MLIACGGDKDDSDDSAGRTTPSGTATGMTATGGTGTTTGSTATAVTVSDVAATVSATMGTVVHVTWSTDVAASGHVEFGVDGMMDRSTRATASGTAHSATLVGLPQGAEVSYRVVVGDDVGEASVVTTGTLPGAPVLTVEGDGNDRFLALALIKDDISTATIVDPKGNVVWQYADTRGLSVYRVHVKNDGSGIVYTATLIGGRPNEDSVIVHVSWDGEETAVVPVPNLAHDFVEMDDGTLVSLAHAWQDDEEGNSLLSVAPDGTVTEIWSAWTCFDPAIHESIDPPQGWTHANAMDYDPVADQFLISIRNLVAIAAVDRSTGECAWVLGGDAGDIDIDGDEFYHQHQFQRTPGGLIVFDNDGAPGFTSRVLEYSLDEVAKTATVERTIVADPPLYSFILGDAHRFDDGDTLVVWSVPGTIDRIGADDTRNWRLTVERGTVMSFVEALVDPVDTSLGVSR
jgi:hypothetical protein